MSDEATRLEWTPSAPLMFTRKQAAFLLSLSVNTVGNLLKTKQLVGRRVGSKVLIPRSSIEAFTRRDHRTGQEGRKLRVKKPQEPRNGTAKA
jgi:excisionase family DNA binding protein